MTISHLLNSNVSYPFSVADATIYQCSNATNGSTDSENQCCVFLGSREVQFRQKTPAEVLGKQLGKLLGPIIAGVGSAFAGTRGNLVAMSFLASQCLPTVAAVQPVIPFPPPASNNDVLAEIARAHPAQ